MDKFMQAYDRTLGGLTKFASYIAGLCILFTAFIIVYEIVMRGVFHAPTEWVLEVSVYLILIAGFLGLAITYAESAHVRVDLLLSKYSPRVQRIAGIFTTAIGCLFFIVFVGESMDMVATSYEFDRTSPSILRVPLFIPQLSLVIGGSLLVMQMIKSIAMDVRALCTGEYGAKR